MKASRRRKRILVVIAFLLFNSVGWAEDEVPPLVIPPCTPDPSEAEEPVSGYSGIVPFIQNLIKGIPLTSDVQKLNINLATLVYRVSVDKSGIFRLKPGREGNAGTVSVEGDFPLVAFNWNQQKEITPMLIGIGVPEAGSKPGEPSVKEMLDPPPSATVKQCFGGPFVVQVLEKPEVNKTTSADIGPSAQMPWGLGSIQGFMGFQLSEMKGSEFRFGASIIVDPDEIAAKLLVDRQFLPPHDREKVDELILEIKTATNYTYLGAPQKAVARDLAAYVERLKRLVMTAVAALDRTVAVQVAIGPKSYYITGRPEQVPIQLPSIPPRRTEEQIEHDRELMVRGQALKVAAAQVVMKTFICGFRDEVLTSLVEDKTFHYGELVTKYMHSCWKIRQALLKDYLPESPINDPQIVDSQSMVTLFDEANHGAALFYLFAEANNIGDPVYVAGKPKKAKWNAIIEQAPNTHRYNTLHFISNLATLPDVARWGLRTLLHNDDWRDWKEARRNKGESRSWEVKFLKKILVRYLRPVPSYWVYPVNEGYSYAREVERWARTIAPYQSGEEAIMAELAHQFMPVFDYTWHGSIGNPFWWVPSDAPFEGFMADLAREFCFSRGMAFMGYEPDRGYSQIEKKSVDYKDEKGTVYDPLGYFRGDACKSHGVWMELSDSIKKDDKFTPYSSSMYEIFAKFGPKFDPFVWHKPPIIKTSAPGVICVGGDRGRQRQWTEMRK